MPFDPEDHRLTAYALGELDDAERAEIQKLIADDPDADRWLAETRSMAELLTAQLAVEPPPEMKPSPAELPEPRPRPRFRRHWLVACGGFAAGVLALVATLKPQLEDDHPELQAAARMPREQDPRLDSYRRRPSLDPAPLVAAEGARPEGLSDESSVPMLDRPGSKLELAPRATVYKHSERTFLAVRPSLPNAPATTGGLSGRGGGMGLGVAQGEPARTGIAADAPSPSPAKPALIGEEGKFGGREEGDAFQPIVENPFIPTSESAVSTFSIDVDTAAYANVRRYLTQGVLPPPDAVRIEELLNYFTYHDPAPKGDDPFSANVEIARCPWSADHRLARIGLRGREVAPDNRPASNLVFLIDVSGSMQDMDKLPLLRAGMKLLVDALGENDRVSIVVYAKAQGLALPPTRCDQKAEIISTLDQLQAGGSTAGGQGIELAYDVAVRNFIPGGTNRVILATDGDFNVGISSKEDLDRLIEEKRKTGVSLSVLGFGQGNVKHDRMESMADKGNGQYSYIDTLREARKVLVEQIGGTLVTIAKDVKIQVEFNPDEVAAYRLIGYENRMLRAQDFADDTKDAGEIGAGLSVTALYEIVPREKPPTADAPWIMDFRLRFKAPDGDVSRLVERKVGDDRKGFASASDDFKFAATVAGFGLMLRNSAHKGTLTWPVVEEMASGAAALDDSGYRSEFLGLVRKAAGLMGP